MKLLTDLRIYDHPILKFERGAEVTIYLDGKPLKAYETETIAAAIYANGYREFSKSIKYRRPRGFYCAIGRCSSCMMEVDGVPNVRTCIHPVKEGMQIKRQRYLVDNLNPILNQMKLSPDKYLTMFTRPKEIYGPAMKVMRQMTGLGAYKREAPRESSTSPQNEIPLYETEFLVIGGGPAGLSASIEAGKQGVDCIVVDDKQQLGGQLIKQTHPFFSDVKYAAGKRGYQLGAELIEEISKLENVRAFIGTTAVAYYPEDNMVLLKQGAGIIKIRAEKYLLSTGAIEKNLVFENNDLPGVYGAGGTQTLLNVYGVKPGNKGIIIGTGNVALIVAYHLIQAGIEVSGVYAPSFKRVKGYLVHAAKIRRHGIPIVTRHTIKKALGSKYVEGAVMTGLDENYDPIKSSEFTVNCDFICVGVGLIPSYDLVQLFKAKMVNNRNLGGFVPIRDKQYRITNRAYIAGDCGSIEEATTAVLQGKLVGLNVAFALNKADENVPEYITEYNRALAEDRESPFSSRLRVGLKEVTVDDIMEVIVNN
jgi:sarcosine oxidase subunit alpha